MHKLIFFLILFFSFYVHSQDVQWASHVIDVSSEMTLTQYSASQALGKPNVLPAGDENPNAWTPSKPFRNEFIKVGFNTPMRVQQIVIAESYNPSAIYQVYAYDKKGKEYLINTFEPQSLPMRGRLLNIFFEMTEYEVNAIKIVLDGKAVPGYNSIDAIGISKSNIPVKVSINVVKDIEKDIIVERLSDNVNSKYREIKPLLSPDGKTLYFSRQNHPENIGGEKDPEDIWYAEWSMEEKEWEKAQNIGPPLNTLGANFISSITPDGNSILFILGNHYEKKGKMSPGVSISNKNGNTWTKPMPLDIINDYNHADRVSYFMANNRKILLMSVQRDDSHGGRDLYVSFLQESSQWSEPLNLGNVINTASEDFAPFLAADDETLYFSSSGFSGYGKNDIFVTKRLDESWTNWSEPENLGPDINSEEDDIFFTMPASGEYAYFSKGSLAHDVDIYKIKIPKFYQPEGVALIKGQVFNAKTQQPIEADIFYERLTDEEKVGITKSEKGTGKYQIIVPHGYKYGYLAQAKGYIAVNANIDLTLGKSYKEIDQNLYLVPIEIGQKIILNNIFFESNKDILTKDSNQELDRIVKLFKENKIKKVEINGYTDNLGTPEYNLQLSEKRARAVSNYFIRNGITSSQLIISAQGEKDPIASNETNVGRQKNRRVELKIIE